MEYNKHQFKKVNGKKILCKVGKQWRTISVALLIALGGTAFATHISHASSNINNNNDDDTNEIFNGNHNSQKATLISSSSSNITNQSQSSNFSSSINTSTSNVINSLYNNKLVLNSKDSPLITQSHQITSIRRSYTTSNMHNMSKYIRAKVITNPSVYINSLFNSGNFSSRNRNNFLEAMDQSSIRKYMNITLMNKRNSDIQSELRSFSTTLSKSILPILSSIGYTPANWSVYKGVATNMLYGSLPDSFRPGANAVIDGFLGDSNIINPSTKGNLINSVKNMVSVFNSAISVAGNMSAGMSVKTILNPDNSANQNHGVVPKSNDPNDWMAYDNGSLVDPLFNQNYHYNVPMGAANDIQSILPHYDEDGKIDYWDVYYLWNPNIDEIFGNSWYHAKTKDFQTFYPGNNVKDPKSIQNSAIPDPQIKYDGKPADVDTVINNNGIPWGYVATGSIVYNDNRANGLPWLTQDQWGNPINPNAKLVWFSTFSDHTTPDNGVYLAYSNNDQQFHPYQNDPVMTTKNVGLPNGSDFRDAYVTTCNHNNELVAYMAGGENQKIYVLTSQNGINWQHRTNLDINLSNIPSSLKDASPYSENPAHNSIVETPNIKTINGQTILFFGCQPKGDNYRQYEDVFYVPGQYNQEGIFQLNTHLKYGNIDQGFDNYAGNFTKIDADHSVYIGWLGNWQYSPILNYGAYKQGGSHQGTTTIPRVLSWNGKNVEFDPIEPGQEVPIENAYVSANNGLPVTSDGKTVVQFDQPVNHFNINLNRSKINHINLTFNSGSLYINRHDEIHTNMNMDKIIKNIGTNKLNEIDFYIDNDSVEVYIPQIHQFYTLLDLDYHRNSPYTVSLDRLAQVNEYRFDTKEPQVIPNNIINDYDLNKLNSYESQANTLFNDLINTHDNFIKQTENLINANLSNIDNLINSEEQYISQVNEYDADKRANVYVALTNDAESQIQKDFNQLNNQFRILNNIAFKNGAFEVNYEENGWQNGHYYHDNQLVNNAFIADHGVVYHLDNNGNLSRNTKITISPNITYSFDDKGQGIAVPFQDTSALASSVTPSSAAKFVNGFINTLHQISNKPAAKRALNDLLYRINTNNLPNLETGVPGIPSTAVIFSTDAQSPFIHQLLKYLSKDLTTLGEDTNSSLLTVAGSIINNPLLKNIWGVGFLAGGPLNFSRVINNLLPSPYFKSLAPYKSYIQDAELIYKDPKAISGYDDILYQIGQILDGSAQPSDIGKQVVNDLQQIGATPGLSNAVSTYINNLASGINDIYYQKPMQNIDAEINFANDTVNYEESLASVQQQASVSAAIGTDKSEINADVSQANIYLDNINSDNYQSIKGRAQDASYAASDAEQDVISANSLAEIQSASNNEKYYSNTYNSIYSYNYSINYDNSLINNNLSKATNMENKSAEYIISNEQGLITTESLVAKNDFNTYNKSDVSEEASLANHAESIAYSAYYSASASVAYQKRYYNQTNNNVASKAYIHVYNDKYDINYKSDVINKIASRVAENTQAKNDIRLDQEIASDAIRYINIDINDPVHKLHQADFNVHMASNALSDACNIYYKYFGDKLNGYVN